MATQLCFFEDFDSLEVTPNYLELGHRAKLFRFIFPDNRDLRKFSVKTTEKTQITLAEMLLQANVDDACFELPSVALCVEFTDVMKFCDFVTKIGNLAHYQQLVLPLVEENFEDEDDFDVEGIDGHEDSDEQMLMNPMYSILEDYTQMNVTQGFIAITVAGKTLQFAHPANAPRRFTAKRGNCPTYPRDKVGVMVIPGVILEGKPQNAAQYLDVFVVDLHIEFARGDLMSPLWIALEREGYVSY